MHYAWQAGVRRSIVFSVIHRSGNVKFHTEVRHQSASCPQACAPEGMLEKCHRDWACGIDMQIARGILDNSGAGNAKNQVPLPFSCRIFSSSASVSLSFIFSDF